MKKSTPVKRYATGTPSAVGKAAANRIEGVRKAYGYAAAGKATRGLMAAQQAQRQGKPPGYAKGTKPPLGSGARFAAIESAAAKSGAKNPAAVAASAGRKVHGQAAMTRYSQMGKRAAAKGR